MRLTPTEDQRLLRDTARRVLAETHDIARARLTGDGPAFDPALWRRFADLGWLALPLPEAAGGLGGSAVETAILAEELGRAAVPEPFVATVVLAAGLIADVAAPARAAALLAPVVAGLSRPGFEHGERASGDTLDGVWTNAIRAPDGWRLTGDKALVPGGDGADLFLVTARTGGGLGLFLVAGDAPGLARRAVRTVDGGMAADLTLAGVPAERLDPGPDAAPAIRAALDRANAAACAMAVGAMAALLDATVAHTRARMQFGKPLAQFQALRHRMAEMAVRLGAARAAALHAALRAGGEGGARAVSGARALIGRLSRAVAQEAIQLHGAMGMADEVPVGTWFRRLYAFENTWGRTALAPAPLRRCGA